MSKEKAPSKKSSKAVEKKFKPEEFGVYDESSDKFITFHENAISSIGSLHLLKCKMRTCKHFDVSLSDILEAYKVLNGRKVDGIQVNAIIGRFGFADGEQQNRASLAKEFKTNVFRLELVESVVKDLIKAPDVREAYEAYINNNDIPEATKAFKDMISTGE